MKKLTTLILLTFTCCSIFTASAQFQNPYFQKRDLLTDYPNTTGLVALWRFDENPPVTNGKTLYDYFGTHNGTFTLGATNKSIAGVKFRAVDFSGSNYGMVTNGKTDFNRTSTSTITLMGWMKTTAALGDNCILAAIDYLASSGVWCIESLDNSTISYWDSVASHSVSVGSISTSTWNHVALTLDGSTAKLYWNGVLVLTSSADTTTRSAHDVKFSGDNYGGTPNLKLDDVSYWSRALSASEIQAIVENQSSGFQSFILSGALKVSNITTNSFDISISGIGDTNTNASVVFWYCDNTASAGCAPTSGNSVTLTRSGNTFTGTVSGLSSPYNPGDYLNISAVASDTDGVSGSPVTDTMRLTPNLNPTVIYRSVAAGATTALSTGSGSNTMTISGSTATFSSGLPTNVGVGDVIQYDPSDSATPSKIVFISGRSSSTSYTVLTSAGAAPTAGSALQNWSVFRAYTSLSNALAGTENTGIAAGVSNFDSGAMNLVTNNFIWKFALYGNSTTDDTSTVTVQSWTTDVDRYLQIYTPYLSSEVGTSQRPNILWDTSKYHLTISDNSNSICKIICNKNSNVRIIGMQIENTATSTPADVVTYTTGSGGEQYFADNIVRSKGTNSYNEYCVSLMGISGTAYIYNNVVYGCGTGIGLDTANNGSIFNVYNNTVVAGTYTGGLGLRFDNIYTAGYNVYLNLFNNISYGPAGDNISTASDLDLLHVTSNNNFTSDGSGGSTTVTLSFANAATYNYHLAAGDTGVMGKGSDLSTPDIASDFKFSDDADQQARPSGSWDAGADQH